MGAMSLRGRRFGMWVLAGLVAWAAVWGFWPGDGRGPVVQAQQDNWTTEAARTVGVRLIEARDASGRPAYPVEAGDLLFFTNVGTAYGAKNTTNSVVVINAKTKKPIAVSDLDPEWSRGWTSHGIGVSPDARYVYLPGLAAPKASNPGALLVLDARTLKIAQVITSPAERPHHIKNFQDWTGRHRVLVEDFNWLGSGTMRSSVGTGFYVLDHTDSNKVVGGMTPNDLRGAPYAGFVAPDGRYLYFSNPGPQMPPAASGQLKGWLAKIDMQTWTIVQNIPMGAYPLWTVFTQDGQFAWVTNSGNDKVVKVQRVSTPGPGQIERVVAEVPTGPGPYGLRMSIDDKELWVADKGEGRGERGKTITVIDAVANKVKRTVETDCLVNDHIILSPDGQEMWATCNQSHEIVVLDARTYATKARIPMPNQGDSHGGSFVVYRQGPGGLVAETVSDLSGLHGSARDAARKGTPWVP
jgi:DNA-binding beta-propeller fold protein YncE